MSSAHNNSSFYDFIFTDSADPRTNDWFLMSSPVPVSTIMATYLLYVTVWGPKYMKNRKAMNINSTLKVYNFLQMLLSAFLVYEALDGVILRKDYSIRCQPLIVERTKESLREANCIYIYFLAKITELLDTVFFVLRKKDSQISFLHIYHHTIMPFISWGFVKYCPGGHIMFIVAVNSFVHIIMYMYYLLAAWGPALQKYLWWKKYITVMQLVQFLIIAIHYMQLLFTDCNYPKATLLVILTNSFLFMYLFSNFYGKAYKNKPLKVS